MNTITEFIESDQEIYDNKLEIPTCSDNFAPPLEAASFVRNPNERAELFARLALHWSHQIPRGVEVADDTASDVNVTESL